MKKTLGFVLIGSALWLVLSLALAHPDAERPGAISADAWIPLSPDAGFVVTGGARSGKPGMGPTVNGYLMARRDGRWLRLDPETGGHLVATN
jgi:hypothetical protein